MNKDTALVRGIRTGIQAIIGFVVGLAAVVWAVPGVPEAVTNYVGSHYVQLALVLGIPAGLAGWVWNVLRKDVKNI